MLESSTIRSDDTPFRRIGVLGAGAWGTALAVVAHRAGREVVVWAREIDVANALSKGEGNPVYLPGVSLPALNASTDMAVMAGVDAILAVVPAQFARAAYVSLDKHLTRETPVALCAKGVEQSSLKLQTEVLADILPQARPSVLSGPSFASDVARGLPTAVTLASATPEDASAWIAAIGLPTFRPYAATDLIGAEVGGAVKNVLAIACGICKGLGLGKSAHAALIARGFAEMTRLALSLGGRAETVAGLSGLGDLVLTCSSEQSRNMSFGKALGEGRSAQDVLAERKAVTEGAATAPALVRLARRQGVEMPICESVASLLAGEVDVPSAMDRLLNRPFKAESEMEGA